MTIVLWVVIITIVTVLIAAVGFAHGAITGAMTPDEDEDDDAVAAGESETDPGRRSGNESDEGLV